MKNLRCRRLVALPLLLLVLAVAPLSATAAPSLVVIMSVDQMRADYLERFRPYFGRDGFNRFLQRGAQFPEARHRHSLTETAPGHASIGTGLDPHNHGVLSNKRYDDVVHRAVYYSDDPATHWVGAPSDAKKVSEPPASPVMLGGASLGDRLKEKFPQARVVAVALKDRAAVFMAGRKADAALWFQEGFGRFVTSTYYPSRPSLFQFNDRLPDFFAKRTTWELSGKIPQADLARITFDPPELLCSKDPLEGMEKSFPHPLPTIKTVLYSPYGDELILEFARFVIDDFRLGHNPSEHPDLLFIGLSSTDYYGHRFGPDSREIADGIVRLDSTLESFFQWLDEKIGPQRTLLFLTADHGVNSIPAVALAKARLTTGREDPSIAGRIDFRNVREKRVAVSDVGADRLALERYLAKKFRYALDPARSNASEAAVAWVEDGYLYLNKPILARRGLSVQGVKEAARDWFRRRPEVVGAYTNTDLLNGLSPTAPHALAIERSFRADRAGDLYIVLESGWMWFYEQDAGTNHGQPNDDDSRVPLLASGPGVLAGSWEPKVSPISIAKTVGALFGFEVGEPDAEVLEPVLGRPMGTARAAAAR